MNSSFKDLMASIPTCVGVIIYEGPDHLGACTISSFVSVSIETGEETVMFTLKKSSGTGRLLMEINKFSVCILSSEQHEIALLGGTNLSHEKIHERLIEKISWSPDRVPFLPEAHVIFELSLKEKIESGVSDIFLCKVISAHQNDSSMTDPLIYLNRKFSKVEGNH